MWLVFAGVTLLLVALIVAIAMGSEISTTTSALILLACGVISAALVVVSSRSPVGRAGNTGGGQANAAASDWGGGQVSNWVFLADTYVQREEFEFAEKLYRRAAEAGHPRAMSSLGEVLYELGRDDEAEYFRQQAREPRS